ncbi:MAG: DUF1064 domain-containing protein [Anaerolineae bacterium]|nr:DUF1064 domain-containing protein [Anaerolineae bacterium]
MSKYGNRKTRLYEIVFDSAAEAQRYLVLKDMAESGEIADLVLQPEFEILPSFNCQGKSYKTTRYIADFGYTQDGQQVVEDVKGYATEAFKIKAKLFRYRYPDIELKVIKA